MPSDATALARAVIDALIGHGITDVVLCPGSRSAPLAYAVAAAEQAGRLRLWVRTDERVAGFTALGLGRGGHPAAVITTSGTAVANLHPAVLEASHANVPLVIVSADRPRDLRDTWANQTTPHQAGMFGDAVRASLDAASLGELAGLDDLLAGAVAAHRAGRPGPVHLNLSLTEPLVPQSDSWSPGASRPTASPLLVGRRDTLDASKRTVVVAGDNAGPDAAALAAQAAWPLLAEPSSGARGPSAIGPYRLLLGLRELTADIEQVVVCGRPTLSRPVTRLLNRPDVELVLVTAYDDWPVPTREARRVGVPVLENLGNPAALAWQQRWQRAASVANAVLEEELSTAQALDGLVVAHAIGATMRAHDIWMVSASNPIRDLDLVGGTWPESARVVANRGLAGIDGIVSTATGLALAAQAPVRVLTGDLAFLHDLGALLANPLETRPTVQIIVLNDGGGGIFSLLEYGERATRGEGEAQTFERLFGTPQNADIASLCAGFGIRHHVIYTRDDLLSALRSPAPTGLSVLEVKATRAALRERHARLQAAVAAS